MADMRSAADAAPGVKALIERLRNEGVAAGRSEAERIVAEAEQRAATIVAQAEAKARQLVDHAQREADALKAAGENALEVAARDAVLRLRSQLSSRLSDEVRRLMGDATRDHALLKQMILEVAGHGRRDYNLDAQARLQIVLPEEVVGIEELRRKPEELKEGTLTHFVVALAGEMLRNGVEFTSAPGFGGIKLRLVDSEVEIDLTDRAIAGIILEHLQPRFRAVMEGIVR
jgi:V/A-type H+-transporting ATPase subunit E